MAREIDDRKKRKALRKLRKAQDLAQQGLGPPLSDWERAFLEEVETRVETYGAAFGDPEKGSLDEPLSALQQVKLKEIDRKARGKGLKRSSLSGRKPERPDRVDEASKSPSEPFPKQPSSPARSATSPAHPPVLRVIEGGKRA